MTTAPASETYPFGLLVKSWATGLDYFSTTFASSSPPTLPPTAAVDGAAWALPPWSHVSVPIAGGSASATVSAVAMTWDTFVGILHEANNIAPLGAITNPTNAANVVIVQGDSNTMVLRLPGQIRLQQSEKALLGGSAAYTIASFYDDLYKARGWTPPAAPVAVSAPADILKLSANRVGDYTMSNCDN